MVDTGIPGVTSLALGYPGLSTNDCFAIALH